MPEGYDEAVAAFSNEVAPRVAPVDRRGKPISETQKPEPMFTPRPIEGDPVTGDTRDGGDNQRLRALEREVADGRVQEGDDGEVVARTRSAPAEEERSRGQRRVAKSDAQRRDAAANDGHSGTEDEPEDFWAIAAEADGLPAAERGSAEGEPARLRAGV